MTRRLSPQPARSGTLWWERSMLPTSVGRRFVWCSNSAAENVLIFGPRGVGKTHLAIALGRAAVETGHSVLFTSATALLAALAKAESEGQLADRLLFYAKPKLLVIDEFGYLPFERRSAHLFFQLVARRYERGSLLNHESIGHAGTAPNSIGQSAHFSAASRSGMCLAASFSADRESPNWARDRRAR